MSASDTRARSEDESKEVESQRYDTSQSTTSENNDGFVTKSEQEPAVSRYEPNPSEPLRAWCLQEL